MTFSGSIRSQGSCVYALGGFPSRRNLRGSFDVLPAKTPGIANRECQKANWKAHADSCAQRRAHLMKVELDDVAEVILAVLKFMKPQDTLERPSLLKVAEEFHAFVSRFRLDLTWAFAHAYASDSKTRQEEPKLLYVRLTRQRKPRASSKSWSRFDIRSADLYGHRELRRVMHPALQAEIPLDAVKQDQEAHLRQMRFLVLNIRRALVVVGGSPSSSTYSHQSPEPFGKVVFQGYVSPDESTISRDWRERLITTIRQKCG